MTDTRDHPARRPRVFARTLRSVIAEYATDEHEVADEMRDLRTILSRLRA